MSYKNLYKAISVFASNIEDDELEDIDYSAEYASPENKKIAGKIFQLLQLDEPLIKWELIRTLLLNSYSPIWSDLADEAIVVAKKYAQGHLQAKEYEDRAMAAFEETLGNILD